MVLNILLQNKLDIGPFSVSLAVLLLCFAIRLEHRYIDSSGFFKRSYLKLLSGKNKDRNYEGGMGILFCTEDSDEALCDLLKSSQPEGTDIICLEKGTYFMVGEKTPENVTRFYISSLTEDAAQDNVEITARYDHRRDGESAEALLARLQEAKA